MRVPQGSIYGPFVNCASCIHPCVAHLKEATLVRLRLRLLQYLKMYTLGTWISIGGLSRSHSLSRVFKTAIDEIHPLAYGFNKSINIALESLRLGIDIVRKSNMQDDFS